MDERNASSVFVTPSRATSTHQRLSKIANELLARGADVRPQYLSKQLLVTIRPDAVTLDARTSTARAKVAERLRAPFEALEREGMIEDVTAVYVPTPQGRQRRAAAQSLADSVVDAGDDLLRGVNLVRLTKRSSINTVIRALGDNDAIEHIERVPYRTIVPTVKPRGARAVPNRPWNLVAVKWYEMGRRISTDVRVAILDTGVDESHSSLSIASYDYGGVSSEDIVGHGTHVAGIIAGRADNPMGFAGGICDAQLHVWKIFGDEPNDETGEFYVDEVLYLRALRGAMRAEAQVLNLSIGGSYSTIPERQLFRRIADSGISIVAAMGNSYLSGNPTEFPAAHDNVIAVGAIGQDRHRSTFSNTGQHIALVAPGEDVVSTLPGRTNQWRSETSYGCWTGTSMATPHVTGAVAHLLARNPALSGPQVKTQLQSMAVKLPVMDNAKWCRSVGAGLLQLME